MERLSPYDCMADVLMSQVKETDPAIFNMLRTAVDYSADKQKPKSGKYAKGTNGDLRKLEDIDESWIRAYLEDTIIGLKLNKSNGIREYETSNKETLLLTGNDGDVTEEKSLLVQESDYTPNEIITATQKLPYLLKRLHDASKEKRIGLISLIISYEKAKKIKDNAYPKPRDILDQAVYIMSSYGELYEKLTRQANTGKLFRGIYRWIQGEPDAIDTYFYSAMELLEVCDVLDIDITKENPFDYDQKFIDKLEITHIAQNKDYVLSKTSNNFMRAEKSYLEFYESAPQAVNSAQNTMQVYLESLAKIPFYDVSESTNLGEFFDLYNRMKRFRYDINKLVTVDGFFHIRRGLPLKLDVSDLCILEDVSFEALLHVNGTVILLTNTNRYYYQTIDMLIMYMQALEQGIADVCVFQNNRKFGYWLEGFV
jgi:hypothetical protein